MSGPIYSSLKRFTKRGLAWLLRNTGIEAKAIRRNDTVVLMYHRVLPGGAPVDWPLKSLVVDVGEFQKQMEWLAQRFELCTAFEAICERRSEGRPRAVVTFDDGYRDNFQYAAPVLKKFSAKATFFVTNDFIGSNLRMWFDVAASIWERTSRTAQGPSLGDWMRRLKRMHASERDRELLSATSPTDWIASERDLAMTWSDVENLRRDGHEIGCHSRSHPILTTLASKELRNEIVGAADDLRSRGLEPKGIAYPNGDYNDGVISMAREAGLRYGVTTQSGWCSKQSNLFAVNRVDVNPALLSRWGNDPGGGLATELCWQAIRAPIR